MSVELELAELYGAVSNHIALVVTRLHTQQCDESGARDPDRYDNEGRELKRKLGVLREVRDKLETIL